MNIENRVVQKVFLRSGQRFLLLTRTDYGSRPGETDLPGGRVDQNETLDMALRRELKEEVNIKTAVDLQPFYAHSELRNDEGTPFNYVLLLYYGEVEGENFELSHEHSSGEWMSLDEIIDQLQHPLHREAAEKLKTLLA